MDIFNRNLIISTIRISKNFNDSILCGNFNKNRDELEKYNTGFLKHMCLVAPIIGLLLLQPHFSTSVVIIGICSIMMIVAGCKFKHFLITVGAVGIPAIIALIIFSPYRLQG